MIGGSASLLTPRTRLAPLHPARCWVAPLIPAAMYSSGAILVPVWPTCPVWGRQPGIVPAREQPRAAPGSPARAAVAAPRPPPPAPPAPAPPRHTRRRGGEGAAAGGSGHAAHDADREVG